MPIELTKPLIVPEFLNGKVRLYIRNPDTGATIPHPRYEIDVQGVLNSLFPGDGRVAQPNACALNSQDLFIAISSGSSQAILKFPDYLSKPEAAVKKAFIFTLTGSDYVGLAFDAAGDLYTAEGSFLNNTIVKYTGTAVPYPGTPAAAASSNFGTRTDFGNAGAGSYFANLVTDAAGRLWATDYKNNRIVVFQPDGSAFRVLNNLTGAIPVANTTAGLSGTTTQLFAQPEGLDFDGAGNLWVANNNDSGVQSPRTALVRLTPALQAALLAAPAGGGLTPTAGQSNNDYFIYQVPHLNNNAGARPQFGGLQIDRTAGRLFVNEQIVKKGRGYDIASIAGIGTTTAANDLEIVSTNPGNGGIALVKVPMPIYYLSDNGLDVGAEPNVTTAVGWESPDVWVTQGPAGLGNEPVEGGKLCYVHVRVNNRGVSAEDTGAELRVYWGKGDAGLNWPFPWDGSTIGTWPALPKRGGEIPAAPPSGPRQLIDSIPPTKSTVFVFPWTAPVPSDFPDKSGHFCLLACLTTAGAPNFTGFNPGVSLNQNILKLNKVALHNIHVNPAGTSKMRNLTVSNYTVKRMPVEVGFEILDSFAKRIDITAGRLLVTPMGAALEKLKEAHVDRRFLRDLEDGTFQVLDAAAGIPQIILDPGESLSFGLEYISHQDSKDFALRATQYSLADGKRAVVGGQTFVTGGVQGLTASPPPPCNKGCNFFYWIGKFIGGFTCCRPRGLRQKS